MRYMGFVLAANMCEVLSTNGSLKTLCLTVTEAMLGISPSASEISSSSSKLYFEQSNTTITA